MARMARVLVSPELLVDRLRVCPDLFRQLFLLPEGTTVHSADLSSDGFYAVFVCEHADLIDAPANQVPTATPRYEKNRDDGQVAFVDWGQR